MTRWCVVAVLLAACAGDDSPDSDRPLPPESTLCQVWIGYENSDGSSVAGTNGTDLRGVLGEPNSRSATAWTYSWCADSGCTRHAEATFTLQSLSLCGKVSRKPVAGPWVADVAVTGVSLPSCWVMGSETPDECEGCVQPDEVVRCE